MPSLEDLVQDLYHGKKEVYVLKSEITEPLTGWKVSKYNMPHKGSQGAMRLGRLHAHDMGDHFAVHLDMVDPDLSPFGHLKVDSPFLLFVYTGFSTVWMLMGKSLAGESEGTRVSKWVLTTRVVSGAFLILVGILIAIYPNFLALGTVVLLCIASIGFGIFTFAEATIRHRDGVDPTKIALGIILIIVGVVGLMFRLLIGLALMLFLVIWNLSTGIFMIKHRNDGYSPFIGLISLALGVASIVIGLALLFDPWSTLELVFSMVGVLIILFGMTRVISGLTILKKVRVP